MPELAGERPLRVGVVGVGHLGKHHARIYRELDGVELVRVVDLDESAAARVAGDLGVPHGTDLQQLVDERVDAVSIVVPTVAGRCGGCRPLKFRPFFLDPGPASA